MIQETARTEEALYPIVAWGVAHDRWCINITSGLLKSTHIKGWDATWWAIPEETSKDAIQNEISLSSTVGFYGFYPIQQPGQSLEQSVPLNVRIWRSMEINPAEYGSSLPQVFFFRETIHFGFALFSLPQQFEVSFPQTDHGRLMISCTMFSIWYLHFFEALTEFTTCCNSVHWGVKYHP